MSKTLIICILAGLLITSCSRGSLNKDNQESKGLHDPASDVPGSEWVDLFDGISTRGWRGFGQSDMGEGWKVQDSLLVALGMGGDMGGDIITSEQFEDFELYLEWAISGGGNSGIFFHVLENNYPTAYATGPEYQIIDDAGYPNPLEPWQQTGANYAMHPAAAKTLKPAGEFNSSRIIVNLGRVQHYLNNRLIVDYELWTSEWVRQVNASKWKDYPAYGRALKGHIGLQDHGSVVKFRNIKLRDLTDYGISLFNGADLSGWQIHGTENWYVSNGELVCESGPDQDYGYLSTREVYRDYILRLEFLQESDGNSGVFFRSVLEGTNIRGWQAEVAPPGKDTGGIYESHGRGWLAQIPDERENILKPGDWNQFVIRVQGDQVITWLNNEMMTDLTDPAIGEGNGVIALQIHDGGGVKIRWRNIFIKNID